MPKSHTEEFLSTLALTVDMIKTKEKAVCDNIEYKPLLDVISFQLKGAPATQLVEEYANIYSIMSKLNFFCDILGNLLSIEFRDNMSSLNELFGELKVKLKEFDSYASNTGISANPLD